MAEGRGAGSWRLPCWSLKCIIVQLKKKDNGGTEP